jgi:hypothetical protein
MIMAVVIDFVQEKVLGHGPQDNENFVEQKKDKMIGDCECRRTLEMKEIDRLTGYRY